MMYLTLGPLEAYWTLTVMLTIGQIDTCGPVHALIHVTRVDTMFAVGPLIPRLTHTLIRIDLINTLATV